MILLPASAELAANAGTGPEAHRRTSSIDSGASSDATIVVASIDGIDIANMGAVDASHKSVAIEEALTSPSERSTKRAARHEDPAVHDAKRGRVSTDTASGAPALATHTTTAGSPTTAAPTIVSIHTATALAVADPDMNVHKEPDGASDAGHHDGAPAHSASAAAARDASAAAASIAGPEGVIAAGTPAPASGGIGGLSALHDRNPASATAGATGTLGAAASKSDTIVANETSRGDVGCPETPVISRRSHVVAGAVPVRAFAIGRTSSPAPALGTTPAAGGSKSAVLVANATSRVRAHCPSTPLVSRLPAPRSHAIAGTALPAVPVNAGRFSAFCIGRRSSASSTAAPAASPTASTTAAVPLAPVPAAPRMPAAAPSSFGPAGSRVPPQNSPARIGALRALSCVIRRGMGAIRNALVALFKGDIKQTDGHRSTSPGPLDEDGCWDAGAPIDAALLELSKRQRRRGL